VTEPKTRRRGEELEQAILDAAWDELNEVGYTAFTIESVAARAATSKPVIYRRWPGRAELVLAAWARHRPPLTRATDTGGLRSDLIALFNRLARRAEGMMSEAIAGVMGEAFRHPEIAEILRERLRSAPLGNWVQEIVDRAAERGELTHVVVPPRAARTPLDLVRNETMMLSGPITDETVAELVDEVYLPLLRGLGS
jgi:AcrR family transcriptional regulator